MAFGLALGLFTWTERRIVVWRQLVGVLGLVRALNRWFFNVPQPGALSLQPARRTPVPKPDGPFAVKLLARIMNANYDSGPWDKTWAV